MIRETIMAPKDFRKKESVITKENVVASTPTQASLPKAPKISFDVYFNILCTRSQGKVLPHHRAPIEGFLKQFGDLNSQTMEWFETHFARY